MSEWRIRYYSYTARRRLWHWRVFATRDEAEQYTRQRALLAEQNCRVELDDPDESNEDRN